MSEHATLSPSGAARWLACPAAPIMETHIQATSPPDADRTTFADDGRRAHEAAEMLLDYVASAGHFDPPWAKKYSGAELANARLYVEYIKRSDFWRNPRSDLQIEKRLDLSHVAPRCFGTADAIAYDPETLTLYVFDYKYGEGVRVWATENPQLKLYALGALALYPDAERIEMHIIQPRLLHTSHDVTTRQDLETWARKVVTPAVARILRQEEPVPGDHCLFCRAKTLCAVRIRERFDDLIMDAKQRAHIDMLSPKQIAHLLDQARGFEGWIKQLKEYAKQEGHTPPGWTLQPGKTLKRWGAPIPKHLDTAFSLSVLVEAGAITPSDLARLIGDDIIDYEPVIKTVEGAPRLKKAKAQAALA